MMHIMFFNGFMTGKCFPQPLSEKFCGHGELSFKKMLLKRTAYCANQVRMPACLFCSVLPASLVAAVQNYTKIHLLNMG